MTMNVLAVILFGGFLVTGLVILTIGAHGRWIVDAPRCATCGQRVSDGEFARSGRCPECGADIAAPRGIVYFRRRMRYGLAAIGAGLGGVAFIAPAVVAASHNARFNLGPASPTARLVASLREGRDGIGLVALVEAERRIQAGELLKADLDALSQAIVVWSRDTDSTYLDTNAEAVLAAAHAAGVPLDERLSDLALELLGPPLHGVPKTLRADPAKPLSLRFPVSEAAGSLRRTLSPSSVTVDGASLEAFAPGAAVDLHLEPGEHTIETRLTGGLSLVNAPTVQVPIDTTLRSTVHVVPADAPPILPTFDDPAFERAVRETIVVRRVAIDVDSAMGSCVARIDVDVELDGWKPAGGPAPPGDTFGLSYDFVLVVESAAGREEHHLGSCNVDIRASDRSSSLDRGVATIPCPPADAAISLRLRATPIAAESPHSIAAALPIYARDLVLTPPIERNRATPAGGSR